MSGEIAAIVERVKSVHATDHAPLFWVYHQAIAALAENDRENLATLAHAIVADNKIEESRKRGFFSGVLFALGHRDKLMEIYNGANADDMTVIDLDVVGKMLLADGNLDAAARTYGLMEDKFGIPFYPASRQASIAYCQNNMSAANGHYSRLVNQINSITNDYFQQFEQAGLEYVESLDRGDIEFSVNEKYFSDKNRVAQLAIIYKRLIDVDFKYGTIARQINGCTLDRVETLIADNDIRKVVNFGSYYGIIDHKMALKHKGISWIGYDRESLPIAMSRQDFIADNLQFFDGEFRDCLHAVFGEKRESAILTHTRTATMMLPNEIRKMYATAAQAGIDWIVGSEYVGVDALSKRFFNESGNELSCSTTMNIRSHNYRALLAEQDYAIVEEKAEPLIAFYNQANIINLAVFSSPIIKTFVARRVR